MNGGAWRGLSSGATLRVSQSMTMLGMAWQRTLDSHGIAKIRFNVDPEVAPGVAR